MGHYRSEMGFEEQDRKEADAKEKRLVRMTNALRKELKVKGTPRVLAEILVDMSKGSRYDRE